jgi:hypothetical protein
LKTSLENGGDVRGVQFVVFTDEPVEVILSFTDQLSPGLENDEFVSRVSCFLAELKSS